MSTYAQDITDPNYVNHLNSSIMMTDELDDEDKKKALILITMLYKFQLDFPDCKILCMNPSETCMYLSSLSFHPNLVAFITLKMEMYYPSLGEIMSCVCSKYST